MPVAAKLSRHFYEQLGDDVANELVDWFNSVDSTYKADLKDLNDRNWERFRGELRTQFAEFRTEMDGKLAELRVEMNDKFAELRAEMNDKFAELRTEMDRRFAAQDVKIAELRAELVKWMFIFWAGTVIPLAALILSIAAAQR